MKFVKSEKLFKTDCGSGELTLIFLHGTAGDHSDFNYQVNEFKEKFRVIAYDLRGHGRSFAPQAGYSIRDIASDIDEDLTQLGLLPGTAVIIGHSLGGLVALELASQRIKCLRGIVLIDAPILIPQHVQAAISPYTDAFQGVHSKEKIEEFANAFFFAPNDEPKRRQAIINRLVNFPREIFLQIWKETGSYDAETAVRLCQLPALFIHASVPTDIAKLLKSSKFFSAVSTQKSSHYAQFESKEEVNAMIYSFVALKVIRFIAHINS